MLRYPADVPVDRPSVGAMGWSGDQTPNRFKPYVFGASPLALRPECEDPPTPPRKKRAHDPAKIRAANIKRYERSDLDTAWEAAQRTRGLLAEIEAENRAREKKKKKKRKKAKPPKHRPAPTPPEPPAVRSASRRPVPAQGWAPLTGADVDDLLSDLEVTDESTDQRPPVAPAWRDQAAMLGVLRSDAREYL